MTKQIRMLMIMREVSVNELAKRLNTSSSNMTNKFKRDNFSEKELVEIAHALNCRLDIALIDNETNQRIV